MAWWSRKRRSTPETPAGRMVQPARQTAQPSQPGQPSVPVSPGMTAYEVTERLGPPLDVMDMAELIGGSSFGISRSGPQTRIVGKAQLSDLPDKLFWIYYDVPEPGRETDIVLDGGRLSSVKVRAYDAPSRHRAENPWAEELITEHVARVAAERRDGLTDRPAWRALTGADAVEFALNHPLQPAEPGRVQANAARFRDLDLLVSLFDTTAPGEIRARMPGGYFATLDGLLRARGIRLGGTDVAHWILCRDGDRTMAHLAYVAADRSIPALLPWDLLSDEERAGGHKTS